jgi:hypothetical protein
VHLVERRQRPKPGDVRWVAVEEGRRSKRKGAGGGGNSNAPRWYSRLIDGILLFISMVFF